MSVLELRLFVCQDKFRKSIKWNIICVKYIDVFLKKRSKNPKIKKKIFFSRIQPQQLQFDSIASHVNQSMTITPLTLDIGIAAKLFMWAIPQRK